jgi:hypothetical protein
MGKPTTEVKRIVRKHDPKPVPKDVVTEAPRSSEVLSSPAAAQPVQTEILTESLARKHITIDREYEELMKRARAALSHKMPAAAELDILKEGLRQIIKQAEKRKGIVDKPRANKVGKDGKISDSVKRFVEKRDQGKCQWPSEDGGICGSTHRVQFHHIQDRGKGGEGTPDNIIQLCQQHNLLAAEIAWGRPQIERYRKRQHEKLQSQRSEASREKKAADELQSQLDFHASP